MIVIIDYGVGNTGSISNMFKKLGFICKVSNDKETIKDASHIILPGVGSFDNAMKKLLSTGLVPDLTNLVLIEKRPILGICLGMQILFSRSEEGSLPGLNWIEGNVVKFTDEYVGKLKIPHMGWNNVKPQNESNLFANLESEPRYYFTHSYYVNNIKDEQVIGVSHYGNDFICAVNSENIFGVQFHPEKSHKFGLQLFKNFLNT